MTRKALAIVLSCLILVAIGVGYAVRTYMITQNLGGFPPARTDQWVIGGNQTLSWTGNPPEYGSSGTFTWNNSVDVTCGGLLHCNITITISGLLTGWSMTIDPYQGRNLGNGVYTWEFAQPTYSCSSYCSPTGWYAYAVNYSDYPLNGAPPISVSWTWTA